MLFELLLSLWPIFLTVLHYLFWAVVIFFALIVIMQKC